MNVAPATLRQEQLYTDTVDVYLPKEQAVGADKRLTGTAAGVVDQTPAYEDQLAKYFPSSEYNQNSPGMGRTLNDNMLTLDRFHFPSGVQVVDGAVIHLKTSGVPDTGSYYRCQGNGEDWPGTETRQSAYCRVFCKRIPQPMELATV